MTVYSYFLFFYHPLLRSLPLYWFHVLFFFSLRCCTIDFASLFFLIHNTELLTRHVAVTSQASFPSIFFSSSSPRLVWVTDGSSLTHFLAVNFLLHGTECRINSDKTKNTKASLSLLPYLFLRVIQNWVTAQKTKKQKDLTMFYLFVSFLISCAMWCHKLHIWIEELEEQKHPACEK